MKKSTVMQMKLEGHKLTIVCQLRSGVRSKSGKTLLVATSNGFKSIPGTDYQVCLNVTKTPRYFH